METAILFLIFNRPDTTARVFDAIRKAKPRRLYIAADGPRINKAGEPELCKETRKIVEKIDWLCEVKKLFRHENLGCKVAVSSAIDWFFEHEEEGIILEDDCLPNSSFFTFCQTLLEKYRDNEQIMMICGDNFLSGMKNRDNKSSYYFSKYGFVWGWATWRRAWSKYDVNLSKLPAFKSKEKIKRIFNNASEQKYWLDIFDLAAAGKIDTWDYQLVFSIFNNNGLSAVSNENLVSNIGFSDNSTHTKEGPLSNLETFEISNIVHPKSVDWDTLADRYFYRNHFNPTSFMGFVYQKLSQIPTLKKIYEFILKIITPKNQVVINRRNKLSAAKHLIKISHKGSDICCEKGFSVFNGHDNIMLGSHINLGDVLISAGNKNGKVIIGDYVFFGQKIMILARGHDYNFFNLERQNTYSEKAIHIEEGAWIASGAIILGGVVIGQHSVVGAGSVVTKNVPEYSIVAGNPAKVIRTIQRKKDEV
ncbi:MAG: acyltransferase [Candidatus Berkelbacteria bacterium]